MLLKQVVFVSLSTPGLDDEPGSTTHGLNQLRVYSSSKAPLNMLATHYAINYKTGSWEINVAHPGVCPSQINGYYGRTRCSGSHRTLSAPYGYPGAGRRDEHIR